VRILHFPVAVIVPIEDLSEEDEMLVSPSVLAEELLAHHSEHNLGDEGRFDWWVLGGRFSGRFDATGMGRDVFPLSEATDDPPYAYVAPDGAYIERPFDWKEAKEIFKGYHCVIFDCHS
jgi:hypothetical protein